MDNNFKIIVAILILAIIVVGIYIVFNSNNNQPNTQIENEESNYEPIPSGDNPQEIKINNQSYNKPPSLPE